MLQWVCFAGIAECGGSADAVQALSMHFLSVKGGSR